MSTDLQHSFAGATPRPATRRSDRIALRDYIRTVEIGAFQEERGADQRLRFEVVVDLQEPEAPLADDVDRIFTYDALTAAVDGVLAGARINLLETVAEHIAGRLLRDPRARAVFVRIDKLDRGPFELGIEMVRLRSDAILEQDEVPETAAHPLLVHLSNAAIADPRLGTWLDQIAGRGRPVILTVGLPDGPRPDAGGVMTQRRVDLLAMAQNAWVLAGRDARCVVVETRTELDHAVSIGEMVVWAPAKMVLDAADPPNWEAEDIGSLPAWLAGVLDAAQRLSLGGDLPGAITVPLADRLAL